MLIFPILNSLHTSVIRWDRRLAPPSESNASGTPNTATISFTSSSVILLDFGSGIGNTIGHLVIILKYNDIPIASLSSGKFHNVDSDNLKWSLHWNRMQRQLSSSTTTSHNCTFWAILSKLNSISIHTFPPPSCGQHLMKAISREMSCIYGP